MGSARGSPSTRPTSCSLSPRRSGCSRIICRKTRLPCCTARLASASRSSRSPWRPRSPRISRGCDGRRPGARCSTSLPRAADALFSLRGDAGLPTHACEKQKGAAAVEPCQLRLEKLGGSWVIEPAGIVASTDTLTKLERQALQALNAVALAEGATSREWQESSQMANGSYFRARKRLVDLALVKWEGKPKRYSLTGMGINRALPTPN